MVMTLLVLLCNSTMATLAHGVIHSSHPPQRGRRCRQIRGA